MKRTLISFLSIAVTAVVFLGGCSKEKLMSFEQQPKVYIYTGGDTLPVDSTTYSFATQLPETVQDTFFIPIRVIGQAVNHERMVHYELLDQSSADADTYELLPAKIPADSFAGVIPIRLIKQEKLKTADARLWIRITPSADFEPGVADQLTYLLKVNNYLTKPDSWVQSYFGDFSQVKYGLIIRETGYTDFTGMLPPSWVYIMQTAKNALLAYKAETGKDMVDEFGNKITFPF